MYRERQRERRERLLPAREVRECLPRAGIRPARRVAPFQLPCQEQRWVSLPFRQQQQQQQDLFVGVEPEWVSVGIDQLRLRRATGNCKLGGRPRPRTSALAGSAWTRVCRVQHAQRLCDFERTATQCGCWLLRAQARLWQLFPRSCGGWRSTQQMGQARCGSSTGSDRGWRGGERVLEEGRGTPDGHEDSLGEEDVLVEGHDEVDVTYATRQRAIDPACTGACAVRTQTR